MNPPNYIITPYSTLSAISAAFSLFVGLIAFIRFRNSGGKFLAFTMFAVTYWSVFAMFEYSAPQIETKVFWASVSYIGVVTTPVFFFLSTIEFFRTTEPLNKKIIAWLFLVPAITLILLLSNNTHHWIWTSYSPISSADNLSVFGHGWWFWVGVVGYSYLLFAAAAINLGRAALRSMYPFNIQAFLFLAAALTPILGNLAYVLDFNVVKGYDPTSSLFTISGALFAIAIYRFQMLELAPIAYQQVMENLVNAIFVLDQKNHLLYLNTTAKQLLSFYQDQILRDPSTKKPKIGDVIDFSENIIDAQSDITLGRPGSYRNYLVKITNLSKANGSPSGNVFVLDDVTAQRNAQQVIQRAAITNERDALIEDMNKELDDLFNSMNGRIETIGKQIKLANYDSALSHLETLHVATQSANREVRKSMLDINTNTQDVRGFSNMLKAYIESFQSIATLRVYLSLPNNSIDHLLSRNNFSVLFHIIQDSLTTANKITKAQLVQFIFSIENKHLGILISEDGSVPAEFAQKHQKALENIRMTCGKINAEADIRTSGEQGTQILLKFPLLEKIKAEYDLAGVRVMLADPHTLFSEGFSHLLSDEGMNVLGVVHIVDEIIQLTKELQPDVLILDPSTPRLEKTQTLAKVCDHSPKTRVICLGDEPSDAMIAHVIQNNVHGYLLKEQTTEEIMTSLLTILNGEKVYAPRLANRMASAYMEPKASPQEQARRKLKAEGLSERQIEILEMVASGRIYKEIAAELTLSESAIKYHTERILTTLKLKNRGELVKYAYQIGLVANRRNEN